jgi:predicted metal-binding protein
MDACGVYAIIICTRCRNPVTGARDAIDLAARLEAASASRFRVETVACMAGCDRPLAVGFRAPDKATYLFGDIDPSTDTDALVDFGALYESLPDGWCNEGNRPDALRGKTLARIPAYPRVAP